ncbi:hypothetical protein V6C27_09465 [Peptococcaceae bacterium 1198_IL3148]
MRLVARFKDKKQVNFLVDSLERGGFNRDDLIISDLQSTETHPLGSADEVAEEVAFVKRESDSLWNTASYGEDFPALAGKNGTIVAVELPKHDVTRVQQMMEDAGADEIIKD